MAPAYVHVTCGVIIINKLVTAIFFYATVVLWVSVVWWAKDDEQLIHMTNMPAILAPRR